MELKAVIFDLDGTVVADELVWGNAFRDVLEGVGIWLSAKYPHKGGIGISENWPLLIEKYNINTKRSIGQLTELTVDAFFDRLNEVEVKKGFFKFSSDLLINDVKRILATSSTDHIAKRIIAALNLQNEFEAIVTGSDVKEKKPDPEIFLKACAKANVEPEEALVIEDSEAGFEAAHKAGMKVIAIRVNKGRNVDESKADRVVKDFTELSYEKLSLM